MWFVESKQRQSELEQIEIARAWTRNHTPLFLRIIETVTQEVLANGEFESDDEADIARISSPDPFTRPLCHGVIKRFPNHELIFGIIKRLNYPIYLKTDHADLGRMHSDFTLGNLHIDPLFGQFFPNSVDWLVARHPQLFVEHVLVASERDIARTFGASYEG